MKGAKATARTKNEIAAATVESDKKRKQELESAGAGEEEMCLICCEPHDCGGVNLPCAHQALCLLCSLRLFILYKDPRCIVCQQKILGLVLSPRGRINSVDELRKVSKKDPNRDVWYRNEKMESYARALWQYKCQECQEDLKALDKLKNHHKTVHKKSMCEVCLKGKKVFLSEQTLYPLNKLGEHMVHGDPADSTVPKNGHPQCEFCRTRFFNSDDLYEHMQQTHTTCPICSYDNPYEYFANEAELLVHMRQHHFVCAECSAPFKTDIELKSHRLRDHSDQLSRAEKKKLRQVDLSTLFKEAEPQRGEPQRGEPSRRGRGRQDRKNANRYDQYDETELYEENSSEPYRDRGTKSDRSQNSGGPKPDRNQNNGAPKPDRNQNNGAPKPDRNQNNGVPKPDRNQNKQTTVKIESSAEVSKNEKKKEQPEDSLPPQQKSGGNIAAVKGGGSSSQLPSSETNGNGATLSSKSELERSNMILMRKIKAALGNDRVLIDRFKTISKQLLQGMVTPEEYYKQYRELFGSEVANSLFPDLISPIPNVELQKALSRIHYDYVNHHLSFPVLGLTEATEKSHPTTSQNLSGGWKQRGTSSLSNKLEDESHFPTLGGGGGGGGAAPYMPSISASSKQTAPKTYNPFGHNPAWKQGKK